MNAMVSEAPKMHGVLNVECVPAVLATDRSSVAEKIAEERERCAKLQPQILGAPLENQSSVAQKIALERQRCAQLQKLLDLSQRELSPRKHEVMEFPDKPWSFRHTATGDAIGKWSADAEECTADEALGGMATVTLSSVQVEKDASSNVVAPYPCMSGERELSEPEVEVPPRGDAQAFRHARDVKPSRRRRVGTAVEETSDQAALEETITELFGKEGVVQQRLKRDAVAVAQIQRLDDAASQPTTQGATLRRARPVPYEMNWNLTDSLLDLDTVRGVLRRRSQSDRSQSDSIDVEKVSSSNDGSSSAARELSGSALGRSASQRSTLSCSSTSSAAHAEQEFMLMLTHGPDAMRNLVPELAMEPDMRAMRNSSSNGAEAECNPSTLHTGASDVQDEDILIVGEGGDWEEDDDDMIMFGNEDHLGDAQFSAVRPHTGDFYVTYPKTEKTGRDASRSKSSTSKPPRHRSPSGDGHSAQRRSRDRDAGAEFWDQLWP